VNVLKRSGDLRDNHDDNHINLSRLIGTRIVWRHCLEGRLRKDVQEKSDFDNKKFQHNVRIHHSLEKSTTFPSKSCVLSKMELLLTTPSILGDKKVNYPTYQWGSSSPWERVQTKSVFVPDRAKLKSVFVPGRARKPCLLLKTVFP